MRAADRPVRYRVGTPKGRLTRLEKSCLAKPWEQAKASVQVKRLPKAGELYVLARGAGRVGKERAMRRRRLKGLQKQCPGRNDLLMKIGAARKAAGRAFRLVDTRPAPLWQPYIQLTEVEQAFKALQNDLGLRPIHHPLEHRSEAYSFVAFMAYCLQVTLKNQARALAPGLTARAILEKLSAIQRVDVHLPTTGREFVLTRHTQTDADRSYSFSA